MKNPHVWIAGVSALVVLGVAIVDVTKNSPGPLAAVHGREESLQGRSCSECHGGWTSSMTESCLECHAPIEEHMSASEGLHGVIGDLAQKCALCHSEHHGAGFALVNRQSFAQAGVPDPDAFDHELVGFAMAGKHLEQECADCHENAKVRVLEPGTHRFLGLDQDCSTCHEDPHEGQMGFACAECHGQESFEELESLGHDEFLPLKGGHADLSCRECHAEGDPHALEVLGGPRPPQQRACLDCHASPHDPSFVEGVARLFSMTDASSCGVCHEAEHVSFDEERIDVSAAQHAASGFPLNAPHDTAACEDCHAPEGDFAERYPGRDRDRCSACHEDPHEGQFAEGPFSTGCLACHERHQFEPHAFTEVEHQRAALVLEGAHLEQECSTCHVDPEPGRARVFRGIESECSACHADAHLGFFVDRAKGTEWLDSASDCSTCHLSTTFDEVPEESFDHTDWTGFAVLGSHAQGSCEECHPRARAPDDYGRTFGRVHEAFGPFESCATCHRDPHEGQFDLPDLPAAIEGRTSCGRCHTEVSFRSGTEDFDHLTWTGFSLRGRHSEVSCSACHAPLRRPDELGRTWKRAAGDQCSACHSDPHAGQFDEPGFPGDPPVQAECNRCHASSERFADLAFHHNRDTNFPLRDAHAELDCGACHKPEEQPDGTSVVRYRPLGTDCADCHGVQESVLRKKRGKK